MPDYYLHCFCGRWIKADVPNPVKCSCGREYLYKLRSRKYILAKSPK